MTTLVFEHGGWTVATDSWSAASKNRNDVEIAYLWGANQVSFTPNATSVSRIVLAMTMDEFLRKVAEAKNGIADIR